MIHNDRMAGGEAATLRNIPVPYCIYLGLPDIYPIFHPLSPGRAEQQCAELSNNCHTWEEREDSAQRFLLIIPRLEPRAPSLRIRHTVSTQRTDGHVQRDGGYTQGV